MLQGGQTRETKRRTSWVRRRRRRQRWQLGNVQRPPAICVTLYGADVHATADKAKIQNLKPSSRGQFVPSHTLIRGQFVPSCFVWPRLFSECAYATLVSCICCHVAIL